MFRIGEFSRLSRLSVRMLRHYDELGLLAPALRDEASGYRLYAVDQLKQANRIRLLRDLGFGIDDIKRLAAHDDSVLLEELAHRERAIEKAMEDQRRQLQAVRHLARSVEEGDRDVHCEVSLVAIPAYEVASVRMMIPCYADERLAWERLGSFVKKRGLSGDASSVSFCVFHEDSRECASGVDVEVAVVPAARAFALHEGTIVEDEGSTFRVYRTKPVPQAASMMVCGPYEGIEAAFAAFARWLAAHPALEMAGETREVAHRGCWNADDPADYVTEFLVPVVERGC